MFPEADDAAAIGVFRVEEEEEVVDVEDVAVVLRPWLTETGEVVARIKRGRRRWELSWGA
jgi:hypothetical protein